MVTDISKTNNRVCAYVARASDGDAAAYHGVGAKPRTIANFGIRSDHDTGCDCDVLANFSARMDSFVVVRKTAVVVRIKSRCNEGE